MAATIRTFAASTRSCTSIPRGEIRLWLYLSEPLCQQDLGGSREGNNAAAAFGA